MTYSVQERKPYLSVSIYLGSFTPSSVPRDITTTKGFLPAESSAGKSAGLASRLASRLASFSLYSGKLRVFSKLITRLLNFLVSDLPSFAISHFTTACITLSTLSSELTYRLMAYPTTTTYLELLEGCPLH